MELIKLLQGIDIISAYKSEEIQVTGVSYHSGNVLEGHVFVCIRGYQVDGHKYLQNAVDNGAKVAIVEEINKSINIPQYLVENSRVALAEISSTFYDHPSKKMKMIGITATNGKTTTAYMTKAILEEHKIKTGIIGTINIKMGDKIIPSNLTTPESLELQYYLNEMFDSKVSHVIMEVSSAAQEMHRVQSVDYDIVTLNNINREHIDTHGSFESYVNMKTKLIKNAQPGSIAVLNLDCLYTEDLIKQTKAMPITFSVDKRQGHLYCKNLDLSTGRAKFTIEILKPIYKQDELIISPSEFDIELSIPGLHSVSNSIVSIIIGLLNKVPISTIQTALNNFTGVNRRFEFIYEKGPVIIDDHFANPGNIDVTLETISLMEHEKFHLIYAIRGQRGATVNRENAETLLKWVNKLGLDEIVVTESVCHVTSRDLVTEEETLGFTEVLEGNGIKVIQFKELPEAINYSLSKVGLNDLLLLAGCQGMDEAAEIALKELESKTINI